MADSSSLADLFPGALPKPIGSLTADSRQAGPGTVFVAVPGTKADGMGFARDAASRGAAAIVGEGERPGDLPMATPYIRVADARRALALAAARLHSRQPGTIVAVTGTSGKSSVAEFTRQIFAALGLESASLGTIGVVTSRNAQYGSLTTPDPVSLHQILDRLVGDGITHLAMEASSHGIEQRRLDGVRLKAAAFTNLGRDHLDYHETLDAYLAAKLRLFETLLGPGATAVVNADDAYADKVIEAASGARRVVMTTGRKGSTIRLDAARPDGFAQALDIVVPGSRGDARRSIRLPLIGTFQAENALLAAGLALATVDTPRVDDVILALGSLQGVPGRLERVGEANGALCVVDYAHKPEALEHVLAALRPFATGRLVCVFGCGGDRDRGKRPIMGAIASAGADLVIVTDDNPRSEDPAAIRAAILAAAPGAREIGERAEAIRTAVRGLRSGDVLVVAGKGHETGQIVGDTTLPFSDHEAVRSAIVESFS